MKIPNTIIIVTTLKPDYSIDLIEEKKILKTLRSLNNWN